MVNILKLKVFKAEVTSSGNEIEITLNTNLSSLDGINSSSFQIFSETEMKSLNELTIKNISLKSGSSNVIVLTLNNQVPQDMNVFVMYNGEQIKDINGLIISNFNVFVVTNPDIPITTECVNSQKETVSLFPLPFNEFLTVKSPELEQFKLSIYDMNGSLIFQKTISGTENIDTKFIESGNYLVTVISKESKQIFKAIKLK